MNKKYRKYKICKTFTQLHGNYKVKQTTRQNDKMQNKYQNTKRQKIIVPETYKLLSMEESNFLSEK